MIMTPKKINKDKYVQTKNKKSVLYFSPFFLSYILFLLSKYTQTRKKHNTINSLKNENERKKNKKYIYICFSFFQNVFVLF